MDAEQLIKKDYIFSDYKAVSRDDLIIKLGKKLQEGGYVKDSFIEAVIGRENRYPTGLPTEELKIAIPHTDVKHVHKSCICIAKLTEPVNFKLMGDNQQNIPVDMVCMLALNNPDSHLSILQKVIQLFSNKGVLKKLKEARDSEQIYETFMQAINHAQ